MRATVQSYWSLKEIWVRGVRGVIMATERKKYSLFIHRTRRLQKAGRRQSSESGRWVIQICFTLLFFNSSNYKAAQVLWKHTSAHSSAFPETAKLWAFESKWQKRGTSKLNDESIIEQVAYEKMREWRWKWMADRWVRGAPGGKKCSDVFTVTAQIALCTRCLNANSFSLLLNNCAKLNLSILCLWGKKSLASTSPHFLLIR